MTTTIDQTSAIVASARWAAYGDVLGFITELTNAAGVQRRAGSPKIDHPVAWRRKIGGQFGVEAKLPAGTYSDDTQLRLATSRAIRGDGTFDVEAFAKVELPVWSSYSLGAGRGTRAAASSLTKHVRTWSTNFFEDKDARYIDGGGNGAAMRIQPHVWVSKKRSDPGTYLPEVLRNSITTHGHARGIVGAAFHAFILAYALENSAVPNLPWVQTNIGELRSLSSIAAGDSSLQDFWLKKWELDTRRTFSSAIEEAVRELQELIQLATVVEVSDKASMYTNICDALDIRSDARRGSASHTAIAAYFLASLFQDDPLAAIVTSVNELGTDTDSIATMAGAILGAALKTNPPERIQDEAYIDREALRLESISRSLDASTFSYPDLLHWAPPESQSDAVGLVGAKPVLSGISFIAQAGEAFHPKGKAQKVQWQWMELDIGQTILAKVRVPLPDLPAVAAPAQRDLVPRQRNAQQLTLTGEATIPKQTSKQADAEKAAAALRGERFWDVRPERKQSHRPPNDRRSSEQPSLPDTEALAVRIQEQNFAPEMIGRYIMRFAEYDHGPELAAMFVSSVIRRYRLRPNR